jgi:GTPase Era involved in 16S rRNA processing
MSSLPDPHELNRWVTEASVLPSLVSRAGHLKKLAQDFARTHPQDQRALVVALIGATGAGKSTLLNALAGRNLATEGVDRPTSRFAIAYAPDDAWVEDLEAAGAQVRRYSAAAVPRAAAHIYVDTPDLNSVAREHQDRARAILEVADVALVVMHRGSVAESTGTQFLADFARRRRLLFAVNFADELGPASRAELKSQVHRVARERLDPSAEAAPVFALSALQAKRDPGSFEFPQLEACLRSWAETGSVQLLRRNNARAVLLELSREMTGAQHQLHQQLMVVGQVLELGLTNAERPLERDFEQRLSSARVRLRDRVRERAAGSWWGLGALWMRLSGLNAGGLGTAALLARSSLPVGLAVAAASTAISKLQESSRERSAEARMVEIDADTGAAAELQAALSTTRTAAAREGLVAESLSLPSPEATLVGLRELQSAAWRYTEDEAVPKVVDGWWRWARFFLVPLVNLPLLALLADVGRRVVWAYWEGRYLGIDYFVNALALAALLSAAGVMLARLSLAGAVRRIQRLGLERFQVAFGLYRRDLLERLIGSFGPARRAAEALTEASR